MRQRDSVWPRSISGAMIASAGVLTALVGLAAIEVAAIASRLDASALDPTFCSPSSLHTTAEPPETQLPRDYGAIRILLKDPGNYFNQIRRVYVGELHVSPGTRGQPPVLKRAERAKLLKAEYQRNLWSGSLRQ
jgi:hypothetical protein